MTGDGVEEDERAKIIADVNLENRVKDLEKQLSRVETKIDRIIMGFVGAGLVILTSIWDQLKAVVFK